MIILCDVDNCISNDSWRRWLIRWTEPRGRERYHDYHRASPRDTPANLHALRHEAARVFLLTSMPAEYAPLREAWLHRVGVQYERVLYRTNHHDTSVELKRAMVRQLREQGVPLEECIAAYDDRLDVVAMYLKEGLPGCHLQIAEQRHAQHELA